MPTTPIWSGFLLLVVPQLYTHFSLTSIGFSFSYLLKFKTFNIYHIQNQAFLYVIQPSCKRPETWNMKLSYPSNPIYSPDQHVQFLHSFTLTFFSYICQPIYFSMNARNLIIQIKYKKKIKKKNFQILIDVSKPQFPLITKVAAHQEYQY